jgi:lipopolysaccharide export system protein LptA
VINTRPRALRRTCLLLPLLALALLPPPAAAEKTDREQPINFAGGTGGYNYQTKNGSLTGSVVITQGTLSIHADRIDFRQNADNSLSATAHGNPVSFRQKRDGYDEYFEGYAQRIEYDGSKQLLELFDQALLKRGQDEIRSAYISYNATTELFQAQGRAATTAAPAAGTVDTRVRGVIQPRADAPLPGKGKEPAAAPGAPGPGPTLKPAGELAPAAAR